MKPTPSGRFFFYGFILAGLTALPGRAYADGNEFFQSQHIGLSQVIYVGNVRDENGKLIEGALVKWSASGTDDQGDHPVDGYGTYTDLLGHYRTLDVSLIMASMSYDLDPDTVQVTAEKPGYKMTRRLQQSPASKKTGSIEVDFVLSHDKGS